MIIASKNDYLLQVKKNQKGLYREIERTSLEDTPIDTYEKSEKNRGRYEKRRLEVYDVKPTQTSKQWQELRRYIVVHRQRDDTQETAFYISSSAEKKAKYFYQASRGHWGIENALHRVKDVVYNEDKNRIRAGSGAIMASIASSVSINICRKNHGKSLTYGNIYFAAEIKKTLKLLRT